MVEGSPNHNENDKTDKAVQKQLAAQRSVARMYNHNITRDHSKFDETTTKIVPERDYLFSREVSSNMKRRLSSYETTTTVSGAGES